MGKKLLWEVKINDLNLLYVDCGDEHGLVISACYPEDMVGLTLEQADFLCNHPNIDIDMDAG